MNKNFDVIGIGNAVVDLLSEVEENFLTENDLIKSTMVLVDKEFQNSLLDQITSPTKIAGGSVGNSMRTLGLLNLQCGFIGTVADDEFGNYFAESMHDSGVTPIINPIKTDIVTGVCAIFITPDSERTMCTNMGASDLISPDHLSPDLFESTNIFFIEGYQFDTQSHKDAIAKAVSIVHKKSGLVAMTLSDVFCVQNHFDDFFNFLPNVDLLFCNENEFHELFNIKIQDISETEIRTIRESTKAQIVITRSEKGCTVIDDSRVAHVNAIVPNMLLDATGAGDQFAAGYIYGMNQNKKPEECALLGVELATKVISKIGPNLTIDEISSALEDWKRKTAK